MKVTLNHIESGENEVVINYTQMNREIEDIVLAASGGESRIPCSDGDSKYMVTARSVLYAESVDRVTFVYTAEGVYRAPCTLEALELSYSAKGFFRCSKSMIVNIYRISRLQSEPGGRINATMENGEHVLISRRYAKAFRRELNGKE